MSFTEVSQEEQEAEQLIAELGAACPDNKALRRLLMECPTDQRRSLYNRLHPYLKFKVGSYSLLSAGLANKSLSDIAEQAVNDSDKTLTLVCKKCTRMASFKGATRQEATKKAELKGWVWHDGKTVCPKCPAPRD